MGLAFHHAQRGLAITHESVTTRGELVERVRAVDALRSADEVINLLRAASTELVDELLHPTMEGVSDSAIGLGIGASPGAASGEIVTSAAMALERSDQGHSVILVRPVTTPDDVLGMQVAAGIVTMHGGMSSHAAVVARGWGIPAVVGSADVDVKGSSVTIGELEFSEGDFISIDGRSGKIYAGAVDTDQQQVPSELWTLLQWADLVSAGVVSIRANADASSDARRSLEFGATGIGLCRTEHMFLADDRLPIMRSFILTDDESAQQQLLHDLEQVQEADFVALLDVMRERPVTIRLLDPPLHEFLPSADELLARSGAGELDADEIELLNAVLSLREVNPMLGTRGVRLGAVRPGLYQAQVRSLCRATISIMEQGVRPQVEIMIPLISDASEFRVARRWVVNAMNDVDTDGVLDGVVSIGAMVETPRAALIADEIAQHSDFLSFGTNDLTQMTFGLSRDDVEARLLPRYRELGILDHNPFEVIDEAGVGRLLARAISDARQQQPSIKVGVCGEHAGDPRSISFLIGAGCTSLSCSPFRVPVARLAAAQAVLGSGSAMFNGAVEFFSDDVVPPSSNDDEPMSSDFDAESDPELTSDLHVLRVLRMRGFSTLDGLRHSTGTDLSAVLDALVADQQVNYIEARKMYMLAPSGRTRIDDHIAHAEPLHGLSSAYEEFLKLNVEFKQICTDWQVRNGEPNAHDDAGYDTQCIERLSEFLGKSESVLTSMASVKSRLGVYQRRLQGALTAIIDGEVNRFTGVMCESFHDIWMELHEDLILLQRIDRVSEGSF